MNNELAIAKQIEFSPEQVELIKSQIAPKATNDELKLFIYQAQKTGLDPLARQIYAIHRKAKDANGNWVEKMTIQTSIDGFRVIAERSGDYGGQSEPIFTEKDNKIVSCKITVYRFRGEVRYEAAVGLAYWNEYVQTDRDGKPTGLWAKMPHVMLAKVAEALALRKAYPQDLSGLYTSDEMSQADYQPAEVITQQQQPAKPLSITDPAPNTPAIRDERYYKPTNDWELINELIASAQTAAELRNLLAVNTAFFLTNDEMKQNCILRGKQLAEAERAAVTN